MLLRNLCSQEIEEKSSSEDEYEEEDMDEECDEIQNERSDVDNLQKTETSKKRGKVSNLIEPCKDCIRNVLLMYFTKLFKHCISDFLSELGIEKEDEEDSPWDSEVSILVFAGLAAKITVLLRVPYSPIHRTH